MRGEGVVFHDGRAARVSRDGDAVTVSLEDGRTIAGTHLLVATGRRANSTGFGLEQVGIAMGDNGIVVDDRRRSSVKSIYAIGDCRDGPRLTHVAGYEGSNVALEIATGLPVKVDWKALPWCTYTAPEVAQVGLTQNAARERYGDAVKIVREGFDHNDRTVAEGDVTGHCKLVMKGRKIIGASIVGTNAGELLLPFAQAIGGKTGSFALGSAIVAYPTRSEIVKAAAFAAWEPTVFGSLPKRYCRMVAAIRRRFS